MRKDGYKEAIWGGGRGVGGGGGRAGIYGGGGGGRGGDTVEVGGALVEDFEIAFVPEPRLENRVGYAQS